METRSVLRIPLNLEIISEVDRKFDQLFSLLAGDVFKASAFDISSDGIGIFSKYYLPAGLRIKVTFAGGLLGIEQSLKLKGQVRYCKPGRDANFKCGIKLIDPPLLYTGKFSQLKAAYEKRVERIVIGDKDQLSS